MRFLLFLAGTLGAGLLMGQPWTAARATASEPTSFRVDPQALLDVLRAAPHERTTAAKNSTALLRLPPLSNGEQQESFRIVAYDLQPAHPAGRYADFGTWYGVSTVDPARTVYLDWTSRGFHASVVGGAGPTYTVDPEHRDSRSHYLVARRSPTATASAAFTCATAPENLLPLTGGAEKEAGDCVLREYDLAVSATHTFSNFHAAADAGDADLVQAAIVTVINRVNQLYTRDLSVRFRLHPENDALYFYSASVTPFTSNLVSSLMNENIGVQQNRLDPESYDIGHVFTQGDNNGRAFTRSVCNLTLKSGGATSLLMPEGDPFAVDYVAHELGHQLGAFHTQNNNCNYTASSGMEPGSGSTVMSYAGICFPNVQTNSDPYFHGRSIQEITDFVENDFFGGQCATIVNTSLTNPTLGTPRDRLLPPGTPFALSVPAFGAQAITYAWEQYDAEQGIMPPQPESELGPLFRSLPPSADSTRYFPNLRAVLTDEQPTWEVLPTVSREMNFRVTVRSLGSAYGCAGERDLTLTVDDTDGPFRVVDPANGNHWSAGQTAQVRWDVAGTDAPAFTAPTVDVLLTTDTGATFTVLAAGVPNNGLTEVTAPLDTSRSAQVLVRSNGNYFYAVSTRPFTIANPTGAPGVSLESLTATTVSDCFTVQDSATFTFRTASFGGADAPFTPQVTGLPAGLTVRFLPERPRPGASVRLIVGNLSAMPDGVLTGEFLLSGNDTTLRSPIMIEKFGNEPAAGPLLLSPSGLDDDIRPILRVAENGADLYQIQLADDASFSALRYDATVVRPVFGIQNYLPPTTRFYWRARSIQGTGGCGVSRWSTTSFVTGDCPIVQSTAAPVIITDGPPVQTRTMPLRLTGEGEVRDLDVVLLNVEHSYLNDLEIDLQSPSGTVVSIFDRSCGANDNILLNFDDESTRSVPSCPPVNPSGFVRPVESFTAYDGEPYRGTWRLIVRDMANQDGGQINGFGLKVCTGTAVLPVEWLSFTATGREKDIHLAWAFAASPEHAGLTVERSTPDRPFAWTDLGEVPAGAPDEWTDGTALPNQDYLYRLRQRDRDGTVSYSEIRTARIDGTSGLALSVYPTPTRDFVSYRWLLPTAERTVTPYELTDVAGRSLQRGTLFPAGGQVDVSGLPAGLYLLRTPGLPAVRVVKR